jgi:hypothetical protein
MKVHIVFFAEFEEYAVLCVYGERPESFELPMELVRFEDWAEWILAKYHFSRLRAHLNFIRQLFVPSMKLRCVDNAHLLSQVFQRSEDLALTGGNFRLALSQFSQKAVSFPVTQKVPEKFAGRSIPASFYFPFYFFLQ